MAHTSRFDGKGEIYAKARPKYALALFEYLKNTLNIPEGSVFADIGSGTGIFTEQLLGCGYKVFAVEPNADMRKKAEEKLSSDKNFISVNGCDTNINLPDNSVDYVTVAQAFHWFDVPTQEIIKFTFDDYHYKEVRVGEKFSIMEGGHKVGEGKVIEMEL